MKPFSKKSTCPKCGEGGSAARWCPGIKKYDGLQCRVPDDQKTASACHRLYNADVIKLAQAKSEHMERTCSHCGFMWLELPLDRCPPLTQLAAAAEKDK